jgi:endonuclease YncB( thermonuclease family)
MSRFSLIAGVCAFLLLTAFGPNVPAHAAETLAGPVPAEVVRVVDGDTLDVRARIWLGQDVFVRVRLAGIDTPELRGKCPDEKEKARAAKAWLSRVEGKAVALSGIHYGKYAGRVLAHVREAELGDLAERLIAAGFARPYEGGARAGWCGVS